MFMDALFCLFVLHNGCSSPFIVDQEPQLVRELVPVHSMLEISMCKQAKPHPWDAGNTQNLWPAEKPFSLEWSLVVTKSLGAAVVYDSCFFLLGLLGLMVYLGCLERLLLICELW